MTESNKSQIVIEEWTTDAAKPWKDVNRYIIKQRTPSGIYSLDELVEKIDGLFAKETPTAVVPSLKSLRDAAKEKDEDLYVEFSLSDPIKQVELNVVVWAAPRLRKSKIGYKYEYWVKNIASEAPQEEEKRNEGKK